MKALQETPQAEPRQLRIDKPKFNWKKWVYHLVTGAFALLMLYPIIWLLMSSFKESSQVFVTAHSLIPDPFIISNYAQGWEGIAGQSFGTFIKNSLIIVGFSTIGAVISSSLIAYGFARISFKGKAFWFGCMMVSMMLPHEVVMIPQYIIFAKIGWLNSFLPIIVPQFFGHAFFIFLMVQFIRNIPIELDEAARIDGCGRFGIFYKVILPLIVPAMATAAIFSFYWKWEDLINPVLYLNSPEKYPVSLALKLFLDSETASNWGAMFAMSVVSLLPVVLIFFLFQRYIVEGISTSGLK
ncbi:carbohydrate ABC transporter permease [Domibacillus sp. DTU_2020_1001157_1_SI_ALB_TIR_016]|uniref:carbohydrate ABC transporter permease n=1 Tax=Domibacillus sp. DTU_2020_1001157_1_SI_ALB_TIR_016 TaxID=3077789 RepID=UPI0028EF37C8|nr:carbohydrate ABC transporter permease [Domibacillus sp. DTU_2020_1001157_1_SI_ALB_TIR_016]WNS80950.1 carbohydrate ABC transporter permease [Domibacillus sp. DTU_2020_1001157_1_SI_ALB_TIR_016]